MFNPNQQKGNDVKELSEKRIQITQQIRRNKRNDQVSKRRNFNINFKSFDNKIQEMHIYSSLSEENIDEELLTAKTLIQQDSIDTAKDGLISIRKLINVCEFPPKKIVELNIIPRIFQLISTTEDVQFILECCWIFGYLTSSQHQICQYLIQNKLLFFLNSCLLLKEDEISEQIIFALGNLAGDCQQIRLQIYNSGIISKLIPLFETNDMKKLSLLSWMIGNVIRFKDFKTCYQQYSGLFLIFCKIFHKPNIINWFEQLQSIYASISYITTNSNEARDVLVQQNIVPIINKILQNQCQQTCIVTLIRILGNLIASDNPKHVQHVINNSSLNIIQSFYNDKFGDKVIKQIAWVFSNLAGDDSYSKQVFQNKFLLLKSLQHFKTKPVYIKSQIAWIFKNLCDQCNGQLIYSFYLQHNIIQQYVLLLDYLQNTNAIQAAVQGINAILKMQFQYQQIKQFKMCKQIQQQVVPMLIRLSQHQNKKISVLSKTILYEFYQNFQDEDYQQNYE